MYEREHRYDKIIDCYLRDPLRKVRMRRCKSKYRDSLDEIYLPSSFHVSPQPMWAYSVRVRVHVYVCECVIRKSNLIFKLRL